MGLLEGKRALVTGARKGIGRGVALTFAAEGATVGVNDIIDDDVSAETTQVAASYGAPASFHHQDVSSRSGVESLVDAFVSQHGGIDIMVNNAVCPDLARPLFDINEAFWDRVMEVTLKGYFFGALAASRHMVEQGGGGRIVCISSVHAYGARAHWLVYGTAKAALLHMVTGLAVELAGSGVTANCVAPGAISNALPAIGDHNSVDGVPMSSEELPQLFGEIPSGRGGLPSDVAHALLYLCSDLGEYVNGQTITVDGGLLAGGRKD